LETRRVEIAGIASRANGLWMGQVGGRATDAVDGILTHADAELIDGKWFSEDVGGDIQPFFLQQLVKPPKRPLT